VSHFIRCVLQGFGLALLVLLGFGLLFGLAGCVYAYLDWLLEDDFVASMGTIAAGIVLFLGTLFTLACLGWLR